LIEGKWRVQRHARIDRQQLSVVDLKGGGDAVDEVSFLDLVDLAGFEAIFRVGA
jgi:hypothetical protein